MRIRSSPSVERVDRMRSVETLEGTGSQSAMSLVNCRPWRGWRSCAARRRSIAIIEEIWLLKRKATQARGVEKVRSVFGVVGVRVELPL